MAEVPVQQQFKQPAVVDSPTKISKPSSIKTAKIMFLITAILVSLITFPMLFVFGANAVLYPELRGLVPIISLVIYAAIAILSWVGFISLFWKNRTAEVATYISAVLIVLSSIPILPSLLGMFALIIDILIIIAAVLVYKNRSYFGKQNQNQATLPTV